MYVIFCFFKQKTAYEMRISDWSSDVCSSDLVPGAGTTPSFILFDTRFKWRYPMGPIMPILPIWTLSKDARGLLVQADDWDEMARKLDLDAAVLKNTIQRFNANARSEEHTSELQSLMRISYAVFCLKKKKNTKIRYQ